MQSTYQNPSGTGAAGLAASASTNYFRQTQQRGNQRKLPGNTSPASQQVLGLVNEQRSISDANAQKSELDRKAALDLLGGARGQRSPEWKSTFESLSADPGDTPFANMLRSSIQSTLENPAVFSEDQISQYVARTNESAARSVQDAIMGTRVSNSQRGVEGGIPQGQEQALTLQAHAQAAAAEGEIRLAAADAASKNKAFAQQLGVTFESANQQARNQRLANLSQFVSEAEVRDLETVTGMAEILANTARQNPDFSGYAAIFSDIERASQDVFTQRENLDLLRQQIASQEKVGIATIDAQNRFSQAQSEYQSTLKDFQRKIAELEANLKEGKVA